MIKINYILDAESDSCILRIEIPRIYLGDNIRATVRSFIAGISKFLIEKTGCSTLDVDEPEERFDN